MSKHDSRLTPSVLGARRLPPTGARGKLDGSDHAAAVIRIETRSACSGGRRPNLGNIRIRDIERCLRRMINHDAPELQVWVVNDEHVVLRGARDCNVNRE